MRFLMCSIGWMRVGIALIWLIAATFYFLVLPKLQRLESATARALIAESQAVQTFQKSQGRPQALPANATSLSQERLAVFYSMLGDSHYAEQQINTLFALAEKSGLTLSRADYKLVTDPDGRFQTYTVSLPIKGPYRSVRQFCEQILLAIPFASLDDISFKRDSTVNPLLETRLRLTFYLSTDTNRTLSARQSEATP